MKAPNRGNPHFKGNPSSVPALRFNARDTWVNDAITTVPPAPVSTSWWLEVKSRDEFNAKAQDEQRRMAQSKFGSVTRLIGD